LIMWLIHFYYLEFFFSTWGHQDPLSPEEFPKTMQRERKGTYAVGHDQAAVHNCNDQLHKFSWIAKKDLLLKNVWMQKYFVQSKNYLLLICIRKSNSQRD
jgi:hypothetical protein